MKPYPDTLTTSDWVDYLVGLSRDEQIAALATYHRRIVHGAQHAALTYVADLDAGAKTTKAVKLARTKIAPVKDYEAS